MSLLCPKCHNVMNQYERNGVVVDQCVECKGLFLDRGELEKLTKAENGWYDEDDRRRPEPRYEAMYEARPRPYEEPRRDDARRYEEPRRYDEPRRYEEPRRYDDDDDRRYYAKKHKRRSFLEELFD